MILDEKRLYRENKEFLLIYRRIRILEISLSKVLLFSRIRTEACFDRVLLLINKVKPNQETRKLKNTFRIDFIIISYSKCISSLTWEYIKEFRVISLP